MNKFSLDEIRWAKKVIDEITPEAIKLNLDFYPLQSKFNRNPDVMFLGLNPGGGNTYISQSQNEDWDFDIFTDAENNEVRTMKPERLLNGNPSFEKESENWPLIKGLKRIPFFKNALENGDFVLANYYFLSTAKFELNQSHQDALGKSKILAYEMINLINPKIIVVLGTSQGIDLLDEFTNKHTILQGNYQRLLVTADYKGIKTIAILHPSTMAITFDEAQAIETNIKEILDGKELTKFNFKKINFKNFDIASLEKSISDNGKEITFQNRDGKSDIFEGIVKIGDDNLLLQINLKDNYFGIRDNNPGKSGDDRFIRNLTFADEYLRCFKEGKRSINKSWLILKKFEDYQIKDVEDLQSQITAEILNLLMIKTN